MTHLLDTSALMAHYLAEPGATRVQALFEDETLQVGTSILALFELDLRLHQLGLDDVTRVAEVCSYTTHRHQPASFLQRIQVFLILLLLKFPSIENLLEAK
jgi:hypothetical protein